MKHLKFDFDENLRTIPKDLPAWKDFVDSSARRIKTLSGLELIREMGELGVALRILGKLDLAQNYLERNVDLISQQNLGIKAEIQNQIRLAHVYQEQKKFSQSNESFLSVLKRCRENPVLDKLLPFALQHSGKNFFDQGQYQLALQHFEEALALRKRNSAPRDQIESTEFSIRQTKKKIR